MSITTAVQVVLTTAGPQAVSGPLAKAFRVTASECSLRRVRRWREEGTPLRAYLSDDGALMLADPVLGGNAACEPATAAAWQEPQTGDLTGPVTTRRQLTAQPSRGSPARR